MSTTTTVWNTKRNNVRGRRTNTKSPIEMIQLKISLKRDSVRENLYYRSLCEAVLTIANETKPTHIKLVSYGIGSILDSTVSQYQLAVLVELFMAVGTAECSVYDTAECSAYHTAECSVYDPVLTPAEYEFLQTLGIQRTTFQRLADLKSDNDHLVFLYMPHCELDLYEQILEGGHGCLLFGNTLSTYQSRSPFLASKEIKEIPLEGRFLHEDVFNDCSLQLIIK